MCKYLMINKLRTHISQLRNVILITSVLRVKVDNFTVIVYYLGWCNRQATAKTKVITCEKQRLQRCDHEVIFTTWVRQYRLL